MMFFWVVVFIVALALMVKSADWLLEKAEKIGLALGISPFIVGVTIVGMGTSFPELISSLMAIWQGATEMVVANAIGSNIANILLIVGLSVIVARKLVVTKSLIDLDLPLLAISTVLILGILVDRQVVFAEAVILLVAYIIYVSYTMIHKESEDADIDKTADLPDIIPSRPERRKHITHKKQKRTTMRRPKITGGDIGLLLAGMVGLFLGSKYMVMSVVELSAIFQISTGVIAISAVAIGTSLPELLVSIKAARKKQAEIAVGNIFGSNVFNMLLVIGLPALFSDLVVDEKTFTLGIPTMVTATLLFIFSGISKRIHIWEGFMYFILYVLFMGKLFGLL